MDLADKYIDLVPHLPPAPTIATELLGIFKHAEPDIDRIVYLIQHDPSLTAEVLKRCNSAYHGRDRLVSDMFEAIIRVGFYEVYCVVVSMVGSRAMSLVQSECGLDAGALWQHSVKTAVAASILARHAQEEEAVAFTAGLLHDVGKLILASATSGDYAKVIQRGGFFGPALAEEEKKQFGVSHAAVGARLLTRWGFPLSVVLAVLHHHGSPASAASCEQLAATVKLANAFGHLALEEEALPPEFATENEEAITVMHLDADDLAGIVQRMERGLHRVQELLQVNV